MTEDEMVGWHYGLNGLEIEQAPGDSEGQGRPWGRRVGQPKQLNNHLGTCSYKWNKRVRS